MAGECDRDNDTLTHTARILERILVKTVCRILDADALHHLDRLLFCFGLGNALMFFDNFGDLRTDRADRVQ